MSTQMKKVLLLEAPYAYLHHGDRIVGKYFPLGIGYIASYLRQFAYEVKIFQPSCYHDFMEELTSQMECFQPNLVGISVMTPSYPRAVEICDKVKSTHKTVTVLGGHHVSAVGEEVLKESPSVDFVVIGEGEITLLELVRELESSNPRFGKIDGLAWRDRNGEIHRNKPRNLIEDIDSLPFPARDMVDMERYGIHSYIDFGKKSATMITSRGCPFDCIFCSSWLTMGRQYRTRSLKRIMAEVKELVEVYDVDYIAFEDDTMTLNRNRTEKICKAFIEMPDSPAWCCLSRVDTIDYSLAKLMKKAGCKMVGFGIESGSPEILEKIGKRISIEKAVKAVADCTRAGLRTQCTFIVGFPFDTKETMAMTLEAAKRISPTIAIFFPLTPYPGTRVFNQFLDPALIPQNVAEWGRFIVTDNKNGISVNKYFPGKEIYAIANRWNRKFYLRPKQWLQMTRTIAGPTEFFRLAKSAAYFLLRYFNDSN